MDLLFVFAEHGIRFVPICPRARTLRSFDSPRAPVSNIEPPSVHSTARQHPFQTAFRCNRATLRSFDSPTAPVSSGLSLQSCHPLFIRQPDSTRFERLFAAIVPPVVHPAPPSAGPDRPFFRHFAATRPSSPPALSSGRRVRLCRLRVKFSPAARVRFRPAPPRQAHAALHSHAGRRLRVRFTPAPPRQAFEPS